ncbi:MAG: MFS transporter [Spirillospora sp.]
MKEALRSRTIRTFLITQFLLGVQFWFPVYLIYLLDLGFPLTTAVLADAVFRLVAVACEFPVGVLADMVGRRRSYLMLAAGTVLTFGLITQIDSTWMMFGAWTLWGVQWALTSGIASAYLYDICTQHEPDIDPARAFGLTRAAGSAAVLMSLMAAGYLYELDRRLPFAVTAALAAVALLFALTLPEIKVQRRRATLASVLVDLRGAWALRGVRRAVWLGALLLLFGWSARILFQPLALELGLSARVTGWMYAVFAVASLGGGLAAGYVRPSHRRAALAAAFLLILAALVATAQASWLGPFLFLPVLGLGYALGSTVLELVTNEVTPQPARAMVFGLVACLGGIGIAVSRPTLGMLASDHSSAFAFGAWAAVGVGLLALAAAPLRGTR